MAYVIIALCFGLAGGLVGRIKGSSFILWFLISAAMVGILIYLSSNLKSRIADGHASPVECELRQAFDDRFPETNGSELAAPRIHGMGRRRDLRIARHCRRGV